MPKKTVRTSNLLKLQAKAEDWNRTYDQYPLRANRSVFVVDNRLEGRLTFPVVYQPLDCGCSATGNGSLQFPMTVKPCKKHAPKSKRK